MSILRYEFTNFTEESFTGRYGGVDYTFAPGETRPFDPDKHYMLILMSKQLADRELIKRIKSVGRDPKDMETWGKSLDEYGKPFQINADMRKELMRQAIGSLVDTPIPTPDDDVHSAEAGATQGQTQDVKTLQDQVRELTELVTGLTSALSTQPRPSGNTDRVSSPSNESRAAAEPISMTREVLEEMAQDAGITKTETMTKEELIRAVNQTQAQI